MDLTAAHTGYVLAAYALSAICITGLCMFIMRRDRHLRQRLERQRPANENGVDP